MYKWVYIGVCTRVYIRKTDIFSFVTDFHVHLSSDFSCPSFSDGSMLLGCFCVA